MTRPISTKTDELLLQAQLAKKVVTGTLNKLIADLSDIPLMDVMGCPSEYLSAVANVVRIETNNMLQQGEGHNAPVITKRGLLMDVLRARKDLSSENDRYLADEGMSGKFFIDLAKLIMNVQKLWLALAQEDPCERLFTLARQYPELVLPQSYGMKYYFNSGDVRVDPNDVTIIRAAMQSPDDALKERFRVTSPNHKTLQ